MTADEAGIHGAETKGVGKQAACDGAPCAIQRDRSVDGNGSAIGPGSFIVVAKRVLLHREGYNSRDRMGQLGPCRPAVSQFPGSQIQEWRLGGCHFEVSFLSEQTISCRRLECKEVVDSDDQILRKVDLSRLRQCRLLPATVHLLMADQSLFTL